MTHAEELKSSGLKATLPRIKVLEVFQNTTQRHMSAEDVFRVLLADHADIGLATVYRVLMQFEQAGILSRNHFESGKSVFELNEGKHHDHLVCLDCGRVEEFFDAEIEKRQKSIARRAASSCRTTRSRSTRRAPRRTASSKASECRAAALPVARSLAKYSVSTA